jgi:hypothetical protein
MALAFDTHAGASGAVTLHGKVELRDGKYFLTDPTTNVTVQLLGSVSKYVGKNVEINGSTVPGATPAAGASQVVQVVSVKAAAAAGAGAATAAHAGLGIGAKVAIISGVAVTSGAGIGFATGALGGDESPASRQ